MTIQSSTAFVHMRPIPITPKRRSDGVALPVLRWWPEMAPVGIEPEPPSKSSKAMLQKKKTKKMLEEEDVDVEGLLKDLLIETS